MENTIMQIPDGPGRVAVAKFQLTTGHDCLAKQCGSPGAISEELVT